MRHEKVEVTMGLTRPREGSGHNVTGIMGNDSSHIATGVANFGALDAPPREGSSHSVTGIIGNDSSHIATRVANFGALDAPPRRLPLLPRAYTTQVLVGASGPLCTSLYFPVHADCKVDHRFVWMLL